MTRDDPSGDWHRWMPFESELSAYVYARVKTAAEGARVLEGIRERITNTPLERGGLYSEFVSIADGLLAELRAPAADSWMAADLLIERGDALDPALRAIEVETAAGIVAAIADLPDSAAMLLTRGVLEGQSLDALAREMQRTVGELEDELAAALSYVAGAVGLAGPDGVARPVLLDPRGRPLPDGSPELRELEIRFAAINEELIARLAAEPNSLYELSPRRFEELVAELYARRGFDVQITPPSKDHGVDVLVSRHDELGSSLTVVQCKRYGAQHKVGVRLVRELTGAMSLTRGATAAALVTTSFVTSPARALERDYQYTLSLHDYFVLQGLLKLPSRAA